MDHNLLRSWLGLPAGLWPPDHYTLLGFAPGMADAVAIELRVLEKMSRLRQQQLRHPELVTEGMNQLAQALICLSDPVSRAAYDAEQEKQPVAERRGTLPETVAERRAILSEPEHSAAVVVAEPLYDDGIFGDDAETQGGDDHPEMTQLIEISFEPGLLPPVISTSESPKPYEIVPSEEVTRKEVARGAEKGAVAPYLKGAVAPYLMRPMSLGDPAARRWIYSRLAVLRRAIRAWELLRPILADPEEPLDRLGRVLLLFEAVTAIRPLLSGVMGVIGGPGEPGGIVVAIINQGVILDTIRGLLPDQRQALAADWRLGREELQQEYARLRELARGGRSDLSGPSYFRVLARWVLQTPELVLIALAAFALLAAWIRGVGNR